VQEQTDTGRWKRSPFLSRRFVLGSSVAFVILAANALLTYRTIANLVETSRAVESTLRVIDDLKDVQNSVVGAEIGLRGYILSGRAGDSCRRTSSWAAPGSRSKRCARARRPFRTGYSRSSRPTR
jgi:hypothetical protein